MKTFLVVLLVLMCVTPVFAGTVELNWQDNSSGDYEESRFNVERTITADVPSCIPTSTGFAFLAFVGPDVTRYIDNTAAAPFTYCYRVNAQNSAGISTYTNPAAKTIPLIIPPPPSVLTTK